MAELRTRTLGSKETVPSVADICLFALDASRDYGEEVAVALGIELSQHEERDFEDGEHKTRPLVNVRGRDVYVIQSLHGDHMQSANDKLCRLLFFIGALKDASAKSITVLTPYLCYARKDRKTKSRDPVTTRYVARLFEAVGTDRIVALDVHNLAAFQNAFRCTADHLEAAGIFAAYFAGLAKERDWIVVSPDIGGVKRAERFREVLEAAIGQELPSGFMQKKRSAGVVSGDVLVGDMGGRAAIIIDDLISAGTTMSRTARACKKAGAAEVHAVASHGLFVGKANELLADPAIDSIVITDTVPPFRLSPNLVREKLVILDAAALFAEAIKRIHTGGSIVELLGG